VARDKDKKWGGNPSIVDPSGWCRDMPEPPPPPPAKKGMKDEIFRSWLEQSSQKKKRKKL